MSHSRRSLVNTWYTGKQVSVGRSRSGAEAGLQGGLAVPDFQDWGRFAGAWGPEGPRAGVQAPRDSCPFQGPLPVAASNPASPLP